MKGKILIFMALVLLSSLVVVGCDEGVSQEDYDEVVAERDAALSDLAEAEDQIEELADDIAQAASYSDFMAFWMGERPETEEGMQAYGMEMASKLAALDDPELTAMFDEMTQTSETLMAEGLTYEEMMMAMMEDYMAVFSHIMGKIAEALGVEQ